MIDETNIGVIEFIIVHVEKPPFTELGRQKTVEFYPSIRSLLCLTSTKSYYYEKRYQFDCCKYHITILIYDKERKNILYKLKYKTYNDYINSINMMIK